MTYSLFILERKARIGTNNSISVSTIPSVLHLFQISHATTSMRQLKQTNTDRSIF
ncbi:hypothetical protein [Scytonema hofmannii]|uniref:hypothetical protein n=1 Tax=Scytonema hofmannii TaxID=34078 RepID=UPI000347CE7D|nr:hypothetical protein [Scytonema hofmannii]